MQRELYIHCCEEHINRRGLHIRSYEDRVQYTNKGLTHIPLKGTYTARYRRYLL